MSVLPSEQPRVAFPKTLQPHELSHRLPCKLCEVFLCTCLLLSTQLRDEASCPQNWGTQQPRSRTHQPLPSVCGTDFAVACGGLLHLQPAPSESTSCISPFHSSPCHTSLCVLRTNKALLSVGLCSADYLHKLLTNRSWHGSFAPSCRAQPKCHLLGDLPLTQSLSYHVAWFSS